MFDLTRFNTLRVPAQCERFVEINTLADLSQLDPQKPVLFLGHGANILFVTPTLPQVAKVNLTGRKVVSQTNDHVLVEVAAGENWHDFVTWSVENHLSGIENMALIPGTVGAAAIGNIAAYNQNQEDVFDSLTAVNILDNQTVKITQPEMNFAYRDSFLKSQPHLLVTSVTYRLSPTPRLTLDYTARHHQSLLSKLQQKFPGVTTFTPKHIYEAIVEMRTEKLPDWQTLPNAGSFFKNPHISKDHYLRLKSQIPDLHAYPADKLIHTSDDSWLESASTVKVPAGLLLDKLGWRGKRLGNVGTHINQALCVINYGATGQEIYEFAQSMRADMRVNFDINLEYEVKIIN